MICAILVGGKSSRFRGDKSKLFYKIQYKKCKKVFKKVVFVAKKKKFRGNFYIEKSKIYAPSPALKEVIKKYKKVFVLSVDTPNVSPATMKKLLKRKAVASKNPLIGYYDYTMLKNFRSDLRIFGINRKVLKVSEKELLNINYKNDIILLKKG